MLEEKSLTPLMQQYFAIRKQYPDEVLLFQVGDFYELFFDDAKRVSAFLGIALTKRGHVNGEPIPLCGVPVHALQHYLVKLVRGGFKVAICDQLTEPVPGKVVERGVTQVLTPGTLTDVQLLDEKSASYLCSFVPMADGWGLLFGELLTAQLFGTVLKSGELKSLENEIARFMPDEVLLPHDQAAKPFMSYFKQLGYFTSLEHVNDDASQKKELDAWIRRSFQEKTQQLLYQKYPLKAALHSFYTYLKKNNKAAIEQFNSISWYQSEDFLVLDAATQRNLELVRNRHDGSKKGTLFAVLDRAVTPMGSRMIQKWITRPLVRTEHIVYRQDMIDLFLRNAVLMTDLEKHLKELGDLERIVGRIALKKAQLADYIALKNALTVLPHLITLLRSYNNEMLLQTVASYIIDFAALCQLLHASLYDNNDKQYIIKKGFDQELDRLRGLIEDSNARLVALEQQEQQKTGINSLKISFNNVFGYYIEITKANAHLVPSYYIRQQTLANRERYVIATLQELQMEINHAQNSIVDVQNALFARVKKEVELNVMPLRKLAHALAHIDALFGLACVARDYRWIRPAFNEHRTIAIIAGRHPVIEVTMRDPFIANDTLLDDNQSLWIITGPNMGGKSTYLRQVALQAILAQIGSFIPAQSADLCILDRIFTRIGSGDHLLEGKSTFLVEMEETATICTQATARSLVILDEVGRGTSTFDGLAIAQAVIEYIYKTVGARCLFATHYHELTKLQEAFPGIISYHAASKKTANGITFLYKIKQGVADGSFGLQVAKLAELPLAIIERAQEVLTTLAMHDSQVAGPTSIIPEAMSGEPRADQACYQAVIACLQDIDLNDLSPKKAFDMVWQLKERVAQIDK